MLEEFLNKLKNGEYISRYLYNEILKNNKKDIPENFDIDKYNEIILDKLYKENKEYFEKMYKDIDDNIILDEEQCKAILADEKYSLIIAGAGTGKTTTMVSKVKYLVDKKNVDPTKILMMSYTRKATEELITRIEECFNLPVNILTFHSLGYNYCKEIYSGTKCSVIDRNKLMQIKLEYFKKIYQNKNNIEEIVNNFDIIKQQNGFIFSKYFLENYKKYDSYDEFVDAYVRDKIEEAKNRDIEQLISEWEEKQLLKDYGITTLKGEYVKSAGEMVIANFLFKNKINYSYEEICDELMERNIIYRPDFTIDYAGEKIYIEYYGLDNKNYNKIRKIKNEYHTKQKNKYIEINRLPLEKIVEELDKQLQKLNVKYKKRNVDEIYESILRQNPLSQVFPFVQFLHGRLIKRKESYYREDKDRAKKFVQENTEEDREQIKIQYKYISDFSKFYAKKAFGGDVYYFDYSDLLYYSVKYLEKITTDTNLTFEHIIIDEYQDISQLKYELTYKTAKKNDSKVYAVGDDWQSIYAFSGSRIEYIYNFNKYFKGSKNFRITKTYRNCQELIDCSGEFIMKNDDQIKKDLISDKHIEKPIQFISFNTANDEYDEVNRVKQLILKIHEVYPEHKILILGRTNRMIEKILENDDLIDDIGTKITFADYPDIYIDGMTMHKSKGLTYDDVIIIGLNRNFPSIKQTEYWYDKLYENETLKESIEFAEERRLFYVALTRTKNKVYLMYNIDEKYRSPFIRELANIIREQSEKKQ